MHEERLKRYFSVESPRGDMSPRQWDEMLLHVKSHRQRRRFWWLVPPLIARRPLISAASSLVLAIMVVGISLWMAAPWERNSAGVSDVPRGWGTVSIPGEPGMAGLPGNPGRPGQPAPILVEEVTQIDKSTIRPGEPVTITFTLRNVWDDLIEITEFPSVATLDQVYVDGEEQMQVELKRSEGASSTLEPGEEFTAVANITPDMSAGLQPGRYGFRLDVGIERGPDRHGSRLGFSLGSFVVIPPEGALDTTVVVDRASESSGIQVTLQKLDFSPEQSSVTVFAASPPNGRGEPAPANAPMPAATATVVVRQRAVPTPVPAPGPMIGIYPDLTAKYRVDKGAWQELIHYSYREAPEGIHREWTFGPVSANAESFELAIESVAQPGDEVTLTWEWVVPLREQDQN